MAQLTILHYPDPRLRIKARPVTEVDARIRRLVADMLETMYSASGIGLAATQVNVHERVLVVDVSEERNQPHCLINPKILHSEGEVSYEEGCLSVPDVYESVTRAESIRVEALNTDGERFEMDVEGLPAICIQHEMDHLEGKLFVDYLSALKRGRLRTKFRKKARRAPVSREAGRSTISAPVI